MKKILILTFLLQQTVMAQHKEALLQYVDPTIGTQNMGHTYPGATVPFGMVQLSPDTDTVPYSVNGQYNPEVYRYCAGYQYEDSTIVGFSHTHFNGTGHSDLGDFLIMPTVGPLKLKPGTAKNTAEGFRSRFSHKTEEAKPNYYRVKLKDYDVLAELTTSTRVGFHQYTFPKTDNAHIILDMMHGIYNYPKKNRWSYLRVINDSTVVGYRQTSGWARNRRLYFAMIFNKPFEDYGMKDYSTKTSYSGFWNKFDQGKDFPIMAGRQIRTYFNFSTTENEKIKIKFALSPISMDGALNNLKEEIPRWNFDKTRKHGQKKWNKELNRIDIQSPDRTTKVNFYTAMYHAFINPTIYMDVDGQYRGLDKNNHKAKGYSNYTTFSLWDTFRALHPLFNIIQVKRNNDMIKSMLAHFDQSAFNMLPVWSNSANENWTMMGYHAVPVIADAIVNEVADFDKAKALQASITTAKNRWYEGLGYYIDKGYVPEDKNKISVSKTLEYSFDDWTIAQMAKKLGREKVYDEFIQRSCNYKNVYDSISGFMRPKLMNGDFMEDFDPLATDQAGFDEGNAWNYSLFVPQDPKTLIKMMGGNKKFTTYLDSLFTMDLPDKYFQNTEDVTKEGIIGNYVHGNEPSHQISYLYDWTDQPSKTQYWVRNILENQYHNGPDGLGGNDDTGQMSAWYIFSALGFYPVAPASGQYALGSPIIDKAKVQLENGNTFEVVTENQSGKNVYVKKVELNGKRLYTPFITYQDISTGGKLKFYMTNEPCDNLYRKDK